MAISTPQRDLMYMRSFLSDLLIIGRMRVAIYRDLYVATPS
jgi:hypothetical protein